MKPGKALNDYRQSYTQRMYEAVVVISLDHKSRVNVLKSRYGPAQDDISIQDTINMVTEILTRNIFGDSALSLFREALKQELIKTINHTIKGGVAKCEPHSKNELLEWDSSV